MEYFTYHSAPSFSLDRQTDSLWFTTTFIGVELEQYCHLLGVDAKEELRKGHLCSIDLRLPSSGGDGKILVALQGWPVIAQEQVAGGTARVVAIDETRKVLVIERSTGVEVVGVGKELASLLTALVSLITALIGLMVAVQGRRQRNARTTTIVVEAGALRRRLLRRARRTRELSGETALLSELDSECARIGLDPSREPARVHCEISDPRGTEAEARLVHGLLERELAVFVAAPTADNEQRRQSQGPTR